MRKLICCMTAFVCLFSAGSTLADENDILIFVRDDSRNLELMLEEEVLVIKAMLEAEGFDVDIATVDGKDLVAEGVSVSVDHKIADVSMDDYGGIALPCMAPPPGSALERTVVGLVAEAAASAKPVAASRGAVGFLAEAGVLEGKRFAYASPVDVDDRPSFRGATFTGTGTERDGLVTTNGICPLASRSLNLPDGTRDMTVAFIESLKSRD
ncbi:MAG: DJ-1/PfpI family protein [Gammaproteobacteria bacterium]|nr:DJ-1/PfpI family protein [Gammaproteobacteria bacterium]MCY3689706.1 DJ-1/PfpI family protein [Gammaproteobacteria bacterium]MDE0480733.1 DJ-1/PfpI family protein [Gammaproteobacteria bacterium]